MANCTSCGRTNLRYGTLTSLYRNACQYNYPYYTGPCPNACGCYNCGCNAWGCCGNCNTCGCCNHCDCNHCGCNHCNQCNNCNQCGNCDTCNNCNCDTCN